MKKFILSLSQIFLVTILSGCGAELRKATAPAKDTLVTQTPSTVATATQGNSNGSAQYAGNSVAYNGYNQFPGGNNFPGYFPPFVSAPPPGAPPSPPPPPAAPPSPPPPASPPAAQAPSPGFTLAVNYGVGALAQTLFGSSASEYRSQMNFGGGLYASLFTASAMSRDARTYAWGHSGIVLSQSGGEVGTYLIMNSNGGDLYSTTVDYLYSLLGTAARRTWDANTPIEMAYAAKLACRRINGGNAGWITEWDSNSGNVSLACVKANTGREVRINFNQAPQYIGAQIPAAWDPSLFLWFQSLATNYCRANYPGTLGAIFGGANFSAREFIADCE